MKALVIPFDEAQRMANAIASLEIPYSLSRPIMDVLERAIIDNDYTPKATAPAEVS